MDIADGSGLYGGKKLIRDAFGRSVNAERVTDLRVLEIAKKAENLIQREIELYCIAFADINKECPTYVNADENTIAYQDNCIYFVNVCCA